MVFLLYVAVFVPFRVCFNEPITAGSPIFWFEVRPGAGAVAHAARSLVDGRSESAVGGRWSS